MYKKDLILFGAYDRFNFGDILMPMAISRWIKSRRPEIFERYRIRFASLTASDMTSRGAMPSEAIMSVCRTASPESVLIVTGGEVVGATRSGLYMHNSLSDSEDIKKKHLRRRHHEIFNEQLINDIGDVWEYPYLPTADNLPPGGRVFFNAIGGSLTQDEKIYEDPRLNRFVKADYVSVRDRRLVSLLNDHGVRSHVAPCSVGLIASGLFSDLDSGPPPCAEPYFVVQCVYNPKKIDPEALANQIRQLSTLTGLRPWLVPLATASGHSDQKMLEIVHQYLGGMAGIDRENSISSILRAFRHAHFYTGTSLHGTIVAMSYGIPYYPFKKSIRKIGAYLEAWSSNDLIYLKNVRTPWNIGDIPWGKNADLSAPLKANSLRLAELAEENMVRMTDLL